MKALDDVQGRLEDQQIALTDILANEEDVDLAKVAAKLNQQQVALEASLRMIAQMRSMSLLNFL
jgi:flagellin-like hook-associated protein FlgL